jgi:hypothetical protein
MNFFIEKFIFLQYIFLWYISNYYYYIYNKKLLNENTMNLSEYLRVDKENINIYISELAFIVIISSYQLAVGVFFSILKYIIINYNILYNENKKIINELKLNSKDFIKIGFYNCSCHILSIYTLSLSSISCLQIIKSLEPVFSIIIGYFYMKDISSSPRNIISIISIILSAIISSINIKENIIIFEYSYKTLFFGFFLLFYAITKSYETKKILIKININNDKNLFNIYYILINFYSYFISFLIGILFYKRVYFDFLFLCYNNNNIRNYLLLSSITFYIYNEISIFILINTTPLYQSMLNIVKRNIITIGSYIIFNENISIFKIIGCGLSFFGIFLDK